MHDSVLKFVAHHAERFRPVRHRDDLPCPTILEVGALNVNGSPRHLFDACEHTRYVGVDLVAGPGVDLQADAHELDQVAALTPGTFDLVLCLEMLEHDLRPWETTTQLARMARPGGLVIVTARGNGFPLHNEPDAYRFLEAGFRAVLEAGGLIVDAVQPDPQVSGWLAVCHAPELEHDDPEAELERRPPPPAMPTGVRPAKRTKARRT